MKKLSFEQKEIICGIISDVLIQIEPEDIKESHSFVIDYSMDSLDYVETIMKIEKEFNIAIPDDLAEAVITVGDLYELVANVI